MSDAILEVLLLALSATFLALALFLRKLRIGFEGKNVKNTLSVARLTSRLRGR